MVTVRRLLLELGILGDAEAKTRLMDFQKTADSVKETLINLDKEFRSFGSGLGTGGILTGVERFKAEQAKQERDQREKEQKELDKLKIKTDLKSIKTTESLISAINKQLDIQRQIIRKEFSKVEAERQSFLVISDAVKEALSTELGVLEGAKESRLKLNVQTGKLETIHGRIRERIRDPTTTERRFIENPTFIEQQKELVKSIEDLKLSIKELNILEKEVIKSSDPKVISNILDKLSSSQDKVKELIKLARIKEDINKPKESIESTQKIVRAYKSSEELVKPSKMVTETKKQIESDIDLPELEEKIAKLKAGVVEGFEETKITPKSLIEENKKLIEEIQNKDIKEKIKEKKKSLENFIDELISLLDVSLEEDPQLRKGRIFRQIKNEKERERIKKQIEEIRNDINTELEREEKITTKGFYLKPIKFIDDIKEKIKDIGDKFANIPKNFKEKFINVITKLPFLGTAEEFQKEKESIITDQVNRIVRKEEGKKIINQYNIQFKGTIIDDDKREKQLIEDLKLTLEGML